jgi:hypothetical protein
MRRIEEYGAHGQLAPARPTQFAKPLRETDLTSLTLQIEVPKKGHADRGVAAC